jgi:serine/threonine-protein kinase
MSRTISHYRLEEELGRGGMGTVYKAYDTSLDRTVVLKLLAPDLMTDEESRKRFLREARLASALDHPNISTIFEIAEADDQYFIVMQYVPGKTLKRSIPGKGLKLDSVLSIGMQVADALVAAHAKGIVHRDIKSSNVMITPRGQAKVLDFGLAKLMVEKGRAADDITRLGTPLGTPSYMSPEQARGDRTDHRTDIYSFGVVLYEMATGSLPFKGQSQIEIMHSLLNDTYQPAIEVNEHLPGDLSAMIDHAIARKPGDRYQSMHRMLEDLQHVALAVRVGGGVPDGITVPFVSPKRHRALGSIGRFLHHLFSRDSSADSQPSQPRTPTSKPAAGEETSLTSGPKKTLAVMPFRNLNGDAAADFYAMSLADSLITELVSSNSVVVLPSSAIAKFQNHAIDPASVSRDLGVDLVLMGNFLRAGDRMRVTAQLIDAAGGGILWSEKIDGPADNVLEVQDRISRHIIGGISGSQPPAAVDPAHLLKDENEEIRMDAVRTLEFSHDPRALSILVEALRDSSLKVKAEAVRAIVKLGEQATGPVINSLNDAMDEGDYMTARFAAKTLGLIGDRSISPVLIELISSDDKFVACEAVLALGRLEETKAVAELTALLEDANGNVRFAAAEALGRICDQSACDALQQRLKDEDEGVRAKARWALSRLKKARSAA